MARTKEPVSWRKFWSYQWAVLHEAGPPKLRGWLTAFLAAVLSRVGKQSFPGAESGEAMTEGWLIPAAIGLGAGLLVYGFDLAIASARIHARQKREVEQEMALEPEIDKRLELVGETPVLAPRWSPEDPLTKGVREAFGASRQPNPRYALNVRLRVVEDLKPPRLVAQFSEPIYGAVARYRRPGTTEIEATALRRVQERVTFLLGVEPLPPETSILMTVHSYDRLRLRRITVA